MDLLIDIIKYALAGFFGLIGLLVVLVLLFGKRIRKQWEFEAEFRDDRGREFGEFDIESSRIEKQEPDYSIKAKFRMRHESLTLHQTVQVFIDHILVLEGMVQSEGQIQLGHENARDKPGDVQAGQCCRIHIGGNEMFSEALVAD